MIRALGLVLVIGVASAVWAVTATRIGRRAVADDFVDWIDAEIDRARRYGHEVALLRMSAPLEAAGDVDPALELEACLRTLDRWWLDDGHLLVLAPETSRDGAEHIAHRLALRLGVGLGAARIAVFPTDALTRHALVEYVAPNRALLRRAS